MTRERTKAIRGVHRGGLAVLLYGLPVVIPLACTVGDDGGSDGGGEWADASETRDAEVHCTPTENDEQTATTALEPGDVDCWASANLGEAEWSMPSPVTGHGDDDTYVHYTREGGVWTATDDTPEVQERLVAMHCPEMGSGTMCGDEMRIRAAARACYGSSCIQALSDEARPQCDPEEDCWPIVDLDRGLLWELEDLDPDHHYETSGFVPVLIERAGTDAPCHSGEGAAEEHCTIQVRFDGQDGIGDLRCRGAVSTALQAEVEFYCADEQTRDRHYVRNNCQTGKCYCFGPDGVSIPRSLEYSFCCDEALAAADRDHNCRQQQAVACGEQCGDYCTAVNPEWTGGTCGAWGSCEEGSCD